MVLIAMIVFTTLVLGTATAPLLKFLGLSKDMAVKNVKDKPLTQSLIGEQMDGADADYANDYDGGAGAGLGPMSPDHRFKMRREGFLQLFVANKGVITFIFIRNKQHNRRKISVVKKSNASNSQQIFFICTNRW